MLETMLGDKFEYKKLSPEEMKERGILGRLVGVIADSVNPTRNGRTYSGTLWSKVFDNPIIKEQFKAGGLFGQLNHPDYQEPDLNKVALIIYKNQNFSFFLHNRPTETNASKFLLPGE